MKLPRRRFVSNISVASRLALVALAVTLTSLVITATVGLVRGNDLVDSILRDRLITVGSSRATDVEVYMRSLRTEMTALSLSPGNAALVEQFSDEYATLAEQGTSVEDAERLTEYYLTDIVPTIEAGRGSSTSAANLLPTQPVAITLQAAYTVPVMPDEDAPAILPSLIDDAGDSSGYSELHARYHPGFRTIADESNLDDLILIDATTRTVVYSVNKRIDFATSLTVGPHSGSTLASLIDQIAEDPTAGDVSVADFAPYAPAFDRATGFVAGPLHDADGHLVGFVAAAFGADAISDIMTANGSFEGLGDTGETYVAGADALMRTDARAFLEAPKRYISEPDQGGNPGLTETQRAQIDHFGTTILLQPVNRKVIEAASEGGGTIENVNYEGIAVLTAYRELDVDDVEWVVYAELSLEQFEDPLRGYARDLLLTVALFVVAVTFVAVRWSTRLMAPIRTISSRLRRIRSGEADAAAIELAGDVTEGSPDEYIELQANIDDMLDGLQSRRNEMRARRDERRSFVERFLPAAVARRSEQGTGDVLDHVPFATVVVLVLQGVADLQRRASERELRDIIAGFVDEADGLAADFGLERVKVAGDAYVAVCGVSRPYLDHTARSVRFAIAAVELVREFAAERDVDVALGVGLDAGGVSVGLAGQDGLVYDSWGPAANEAARLAHMARRHQVVVSAHLTADLPEGVGIAELDDGSGAVALVPSPVTGGGGS